MYIAALRIADDFGLDAVGIQYQQGLKDLVPASDLAEGMLNNDRAAARCSRRDGVARAVRRAGRCRTSTRSTRASPSTRSSPTGCGRRWACDPDNTLHDVRWGEEYDGDFVWVYEISGSVPASHLGGWDKAVEQRQGHMFFPAGGATINGVSRPGEVVMVARLHHRRRSCTPTSAAARVVELPAEETPAAQGGDQPGVADHARRPARRQSRDQLMARHKANHVQVVYAPDAETADKALVAKAAMLDRIGIKVNLVVTSRCEQRTPRRACHGRPVATGRPVR